MTVFLKEIPPALQKLLIVIHQSPLKLPQKKLRQNLALEGTRTGRNGQEICISVFTKKVGNGDKRFTAETFGIPLTTLKDLDAVEKLFPKLDF